MIGYIETKKAYDTDSRHVKKTIRLLQKFMKAIEMLKGVTSSPSGAHSPRIQRLRGIAKEITKQQIKDDDRLAYLLNKWKELFLTPFACVYLRVGEGEQV